MLKAVIVEDEEIHANLLKSYIEKDCVNRGESCQVTVYKNAVAFLENYRADADVIFLDIVMPYMDGMQAAKKLREVDSTVLLIFVTSMAQYAIHGYEVDAFDFILKPLQYPAFSVKMDRLFARCGKKKSENTVTINRKDGMVVVNIRDLRYVEVFNHSLIYHMEKNNYESYGQLGALEASESFSSFIKPSPSYLVNPRYVTEVGQDFLMLGEEMLPLSRRRRKECLEKMASLMGKGGV